MKRRVTEAWRMEEQVRREEGVGEKGGWSREEGRAAGEEGEDRKEEQ